MTTDNSNLQGRSKKVQVIGSSIYRGKMFKEKYRKGNKNHFELGRDSGYRKSTIFRVTKVFILSTKDRVKKLYK